MPEQPTIIIQNSNQQNNSGCGSGCGTGCGVIILAGILLWPISMVGQALDGEAAGWWIPVGILLTLLEIVLIGGVAFAWLDQKFGWGYLDRYRAANQSGSRATIPAKSAAGDASNYGTHGEAPKPKEDRQKLGRRVAHPDDPPEPPPVVELVRGVHQRVDMPSAQSGQRQGDAYERLRRLKRLLDEGHITEEEYSKKKAELLKLL